MNITPELLSERSRRCRISPVKRSVYRCKSPYAVRGGITMAIYMLSSCCRTGAFLYTREVPWYTKSPPGRIALRRKGIMLPKATRRRRRILQSRILFNKKRLPDGSVRDKKRTLPKRRQIFSLSTPVFAGKFPDDK